jgi:hypothetical protein
MVPAGIAGQPADDELDVRIRTRVLFGERQVELREDVADTLGEREPRGVAV